MSAGLDELLAMPAVDGRALLEEVTHEFTRYVVFASDLHPLVLTLGVINSWVFEESMTCPYFHITSPVPGAGKTRAANIVAQLCRNAVKADHVSPSAIYRALKQDPRRTLVHDQTENLFPKQRGESASKFDAIIASGYEQGGSALITHGDAHEVVEFTTYCPKFLVGIWTPYMPEAIASRVITIGMQRKLSHETIEVFDREEAFPRFAALRERLEAWAQTQEGELRKYKPALPPTIQNRDADLALPLVRVAHALGGPEAERVAVAALEEALGVHDEHEQEEGLPQRALRDLHGVLKSDERKVFSADAVSRMRFPEDPFWREFGRQRTNAGLTQRDLARLVGALGVRPKQVRVGEKTAKGYVRAELDEPMARWLDTDAARLARARVRKRGSGSKHRNKLGSYWASGSSGTETAPPAFPPETETAQAAFPHPGGQNPNGNPGSFGVSSGGASQTRGREPNPFLDEGNPFLDPAGVDA